MQMVFVYGTLRSGEVNHWLLIGANQIARVAFAKGYLVDTGSGYPAMFEATDRTVTGELYEVDEEQLRKLDALEGFYGPNNSRNLYDRVQTEVQTDRGVQLAWVYFYARELEAKEIPFGDWKLYRMQEQNNIFYFAYGSCMDTQRIEEAGYLHWFERVAGRGVLEGFNLQFTRKAADGGRADIVETGGCTEGKLYKIPIEALEGYLYGREGVIYNTYRPVIVPVQCENGRIKDAVTFVVVNKEKETAPPIQYMQEILRGAFSVVSKEYYDSLLDRFGTSFGYDNGKGENQKKNVVCLKE